MNNHSSARHDAQHREIDLDHSVMHRLLHSGTMHLKVLAGVEDLERETGDAAMQRLYRYWLERRGSNRFPSRNDIDPLDFRYALGRVSLIDVAENPRRFRYRLVSTSLTGQLGYEMTGKFLDEIPETETRAYTAQLYGDALEKRAPVHVRDEVTLDGRRWKHEALILPLSPDGESIGMLLIYRTAATSISPRPRAVRSQPELEYVDRVEAPLLNELVAYWDAKRAGRMAPRRSDIDPGELRPHLSRLLILDVIEGGADFRYRLIGSAFAQAMGRDSTRRRISELYADEPAVMESLLGRFRRVVTEARPIFTQGRIFWVPAREHRRFVSVAMPLSEDGATVNMILAEMILLRA